MTNATSSSQRHRLIALHTSALHRKCGSHVLVASAVPLSTTYCRALISFLVCPASSQSLSSLAISAAAFPPPQFVFIDRMITRRKASPSTGSSFPHILVLVLLPVLFCLLVLPVSCSAFEVLHTAASVNDSLSASPAASTTSATAAASAVTPPEFVPTDEWQTVQPGQPIPPGLWVRMDLQTGAKTARLMPADDDSQPSDAGLVILQKEDGSVPTEVYEEDEDGDAVEGGSAGASESYFTSEVPAIPVTVLSSKDDTSAGTLGAAALDLPPSTFSNPTPAQLAALKAARAARLREIAEAFKPTDDLAIIKQLLTIVMKGGAPSADGEEAVGVEGVLQAMELLESLVHQVDNVRLSHTLSIDPQLIALSRPLT